MNLKTIFTSFGQNTAYFDGKHSLLTVRGEQCFKKTFPLDVMQSSVVSTPKNGQNIQSTVKRMSLLIT